MPPALHMQAELYASFTVPQPAGNNHSIHLGQQVSNQSRRRLALLARAAEHQHRVPLCRRFSHQRYKAVGVPLGVTGRHVTHTPQGGVPLLQLLELLQER